MFKKMIKGLVIGSAALTIASSAFAAPEVIEVNVYGASAQYSFWTSAAPKYLLDVNGYNCGSGNVYHVNNKLNRDKTKPEYDLTQNRDMGIALCEGKAEIPDTVFTGRGTKDNTLVIRYTSNASYDGIYAVTGSNSYTPDTDCTTGGERKQADVKDAAFLAYTASTSPAGGDIATMSCMPVHVGASDVAASTFAQSSWGYEKGNETLDNETVGDYDFYNIANPGTGYIAAQPLIVPFGFYAHTSVPFDNLTRPMAANLFAGKIANWNQFSVKEDGSTPITSQQVTVCLRHAGSGTHATLDAVVMRGDASLKDTQQDTTGGFGEIEDFISQEVGWGQAPYVFFNKGTTEELNCVNSTQGAIGYADADKSPLANMKRVKYNGVSATSTFVKNGQYDFWSAQWLYYKNETGTRKDIIDNLVSYASVGANMPSNKTGYWAAKNDMKFLKANDFGLPFKR